MKRVMPVLFVLLVTVVLLSGCVEGKFHITLNKDGSADADYRIGFNSALLAFMQSDQENPLEEMRKAAEEEGFTVKNYSENDMVGIIATKHVNSLDELPKFANLATEIDTEETPLVIEKSFFKNQYHFENNVDLSDMKEKPEDDLGGLGNAMLSQVNLRFILTLPFVPQHHNAAVVRDDGRTLEWHLIPGQDNQIIMDASVPNVTNIVLVITGSVILLVCIIFILHRRKASQKTEIVEKDNSVL